jgi:carboxypeptidase Q
MKQSVTVHLCTHNCTLEDVIHHNVIGEIVGSEKPEEIVVIGGHIDSWDVGQGAHDDGQGLINSWEVVRLLHLLNLRPKRTIRCVIWVDEEQSGRGCHAYANKYASDIEKHVAGMYAILSIQILSFCWHSLANT